MDIADLLQHHFDRRWGAPYWIDVQARLGWDPAREIRRPEDFHRLGPMDAAVLRSRPLEDFIPRCVLKRRDEMVLAETGGTTGAPCRRVYLPEDFEAAFLAPWERAAAARGFPRGVNWLWLGPSGPHVIGQAARAMARRLGCLEPFAVDCDPRWIRRQEPGSLGHRLYLDHVLTQALDILRHQWISVLFTTPPLLAALAERMDAEARAAISGIHLGGLPVDGPACRRFREALFPHAVVIPGYGNSLFGVAFERFAPGPDHEPAYFVDDPQLVLQLALEDAALPGGVDLARSVAPGERGRVVVHRLDRAFLLINLIERDRAIAVDPPVGAELHGSGGPGLKAVGSAEARRPVPAAAIY